eukprot:m.52328 g.52328  ORF g.52328 m.52328 type:complete len:50 (-) comp12692_c1_seq1:96-245(-)
MGNGIPSVGDDDKRLARVELRGDEDEHRRWAAEVAETGGGGEGSEEGEE